MQILREIPSARSIVSDLKKQSKAIGLVPTMGALHDGHLGLIEASMKDNDVTIASIFVNPLQFNNPDDLSKYPRQLDDDLILLDSKGCDFVFCPEADDMYSAAPMMRLDFGDLSSKLEGKFRPGHFSGVGLVVTKLFNIIQPNRAYFGQKDYQQFLIIKKLVKDLSFSIQLTCCETVREESGLAMSSRNKRLTPEDQKRASIIYQSMIKARSELPSRKWHEIRKDIDRDFVKAGMQLEYLELADRENLTLLTSYDSSAPSVLLAAAYLGDVRLIDNLFM